MTINGTQFADNFNTNGYSYYSDDIFVLQPGEVCNIALDPNTYGRTRFFWRVWFDLNDDGFFDENELMFSANNKKTLVEGTFTIPGDATYEDSRIRVSMKESSGQLGPCESGFEGEVEDYRLMTSPPPPDNLTGINKLNKVDFDVSIYPNPAKDKQLIIELENLVSNVQISVFDTYGSLIDQFETQQANNTLNVSDYAKGVYFVKVIHAGEMNVLKFVKQ